MGLRLDKVTSLGRFTDQVFKIRTDWSLEEHRELWFRGEKSDYGETRLRPTLYRPPPHRSLKPIRELLDIEDDLFETFQRCCPQLTDTLVSDDFDGYLLMQHHGGPTRLLDWSDGSLMALHFALRNKRDDQSDCLVYVLDPSRLTDHLYSLPDTPQREENWGNYIKQHEEEAEDDSSNFYLPMSDGTQRVFDLPRIPMVLRFSHFSRRVAAQRSQFLVFGSDPTWLSEEANKPETFIRTIVIEGTKTKAIRAELRECGVTESVIFPDLDGLGRELNQLWEDRH